MKNEPIAPGAARTLFINEGNATAILVTATGAAPKTKRLRFKDPPAALAWARANRAMLVYTPSIVHEKN